MPHPTQRRPEARYSEHEVKSEAGTAGRDRLMEAMVAACALVARADGVIDESERRRIFRMLLTVPVFKGFSKDAIAAELERQERRFSYEPYSAHDRALDVIEALQASPGEARLLLSACHEVLLADGRDHPAEYKALSEIGRALGAA